MLPPRSPRFLARSLILPAALLVGTVAACAGAPPQAPTDPQAPASANVAASVSPATAAQTEACERASLLGATLDELRAKGRIARAVSVFDQVQGLCPSAAEPLALGHAQSLLDLGLPDKAREVLGSLPAPARQGTFAPQADALARAIDASQSAQPSPADRERAVSLHRDAAAALYGGQPATAASQYLQAWRSAPDRFDWMIDAALAFKAAGDLPAAQRWLDRAYVGLAAKFGAAAIVPDLNPSFSYSYLYATVSPDWRYVVTSSGDEVTVHDMLTWHRRMVFKDRAYPKPVVARMSPDGSVVAIGNATGLIQMVDSATGTLTRSMTGHRGPVLELAFSPDGAKLVTASDDKTARVWEVATGKPLYTLSGHREAVRRSAFSRDGGILVTSSEDGQVRSWDPATGQLSQELQGHTGKIRGLDIAPDAKLLATSSEDKTVRMWDIASGKALRVIRTPAHAWRVAFSPDGARLAAFYSDDSIKVFDVSSGRELKSIAGKKAQLGDAFPSDSGLPHDAPEDLRLASLGGLPVLGGSGGTGGYSATVVVDVLYRPDGKLIAIDLAPGRQIAAKLWDVDDDRTLRVLGGREDGSRTVAFDRSATMVATGTGQGRIHVWSLEQPVYRTGRVGSATVSALALLAGGKDSPLAAGNVSGEVFWTASLDSIDRATLLGRHAAEVRAMSASPDGARLASVSAGNDVLVFDTRAGQRIAAFPAADLKSTAAVAFSPDGAKIAIGSNEGVRVLDAISGAVLLPTSDQAGARLLSFTPDGTRLAMLSAEGVASLVDPSTGKVIASKARTPDAAWLCSYADALLPEPGGSHCAVQRQEPTWVATTWWRVTGAVGVSATGEWMAAAGIGRGIEVFRPAREGTVFSVAALGGTDSAIALSSGHAQLFGGEERNALLCAFGAVRVPLDVCEDALVVAELVPKAVRGESLEAQ